MADLFGTIALLDPNDGAQLYNNTPTANEVDWDEVYEQIGSWDDDKLAGLKKFIAECYKHNHRHDDKEFGWSDLCRNTDHIRFEVD